MMKASGEKTMNKIKSLVKEEKPKDIKPLGEYVIILCVEKKSSILITEPSQSTYYIDRTEVYAVGDKVEGLKKGDIVLLPDAIMKFPQYRMAIPGRKELFLKVKQEDVVGIFVDTK